MVFDVNEGVLYLSAAAPSRKHRADIVLTVSRNAQGEQRAAGAISMTQSITHLQWPVQWPVHWCLQRAACLDACMRDARYHIIPCNYNVSQLHGKAGSDCLDIVDGIIQHSNEQTRVPFMRLQAMPSCPQ